MPRITLHIADKDSSAVLTESFELGTAEETKTQVDEIFAKADKAFGRYFFDAETDEELTAEQIIILDDLNIEII